MGRDLVAHHPRRAFVAAAVALVLVAGLTGSVRIDGASADPPGNPYGVEPAVDDDPDPNVLETTLVASEAVVDVGNGVMANMWTYNGLVPGPELRAAVGDTVVVHFENQLPQPMGIHWHGIELNNTSDGTALTQNGVAPGGSYLYRFVVPRTGVFWYHPHHHPTNPTFRGMYGSLIVTDPREDALRAAGVLPAAADTRTLVLSDTTVCKAPGSNDARTYATTPAPPWAGNPTPYPGQPQPFPTNLCEAPTAIDEHGDPGPSFAAGDIPNIQQKTPGRHHEGQTVLANGRNRGGRAGSPEAPGALAAGASVLDVRPGQGLRLQAINAAAIRYFRLRMTDATGAQVPLFRVGGEGGLLDRVRREGLFDDTFDKYAPGEILLGPGNRADIVVKVPDGATGVLTLWTLDTSRTGLGFTNVPTVPVMHLAPTGAPDTFAMAEGDPLLTHPVLGGGQEVEALPAASSPLVGAGEFAPSLGSDDERITLGTATIDGGRAEHDGGGADYRDVAHVASTRYARVGDVLELEVFNDSDAHHPFHLHGFSMQPLDFTRPTPDTTDDPAAVETLALGYHEFVDEIDVPARSTLRFRTRVDDRPMIDGVTPGGVLGRWVFHCHIFFHASLGMISEIVVLGAAGSDGNERPYLNADTPSVEVDAGDPATMHGTYRDLEGGPVALSASSGTVTDEGGGSWSWSDPAPAAGPVYVTATDGAGLKAQDAFLVEVANVAPTVTIDPAQASTLAEGDTLAVRAGFTDPGSGATYTGTIDFGEGSGPQPFTPDVATTGPPVASGSIAGSHRYGDDGTYTVTAVVSDGELEGTASFVVTVTNRDPAGTLTAPPTVSFNGVPAVLVDAGQPATFAATVDDPGSDDLITTWSWGDGTPDADQTSLVNPPGTDPPQSPTVQPRSISHTAAHAFPRACMFGVGFTARDDDGGGDDAALVVLVTGAPQLSRGAGYWQTAYKGKGGAGYAAGQLTCYLEIAAFASQVFHEVSDASSIAKAYNSIFVAGLRGDMAEQLDRQLLAAWVNFANGGVELGELLDTDGNGTPDTSFAAVMATAEAVRLGAGSTTAQLQAQRDILTRINGRDGL